MIKEQIKIECPSLHGIVVKVGFLTGYKENTMHKVELQEGGYLFITEKGVDKYRKNTLESTNVIPFAETNYEAKEQQREND